MRDSQWASSLELVGSLQLLKGGWEGRATSDTL